MIDIIFEFYGEIIFVRVDGHNIMFGSSNSGNKFGTIENLKLDYNGVTKQFPDLKENSEWKSEAIKRFKLHIASLTDEESIYKYIVSDLVKYGYKPKWKQRAGFRREKIG